MGAPLFRDAGIYTGFNIADRAIPFLLLPVLTRYLEADHYGIYVTFQALVGIIVPVVSMSIDSAIIRQYFNRRELEFPVFLSSGVLTFLCILAVAFAIVGSFSQPLGQLLDFPHEWLLGVVAVCGLQFVTEICLNLWQVERKPRKYGLFRVSLTLTKNGLMILLVVFLGWGWEGLIISQLVALGAFALFGLGLLIRRRLLVPKFRAKYSSEALVFGAPLTLHRIGAWLVDVSGRLILTSLAGKAATGYYGVGATFGMMVLLIQDSFNRAYLPFLFEQLGDPTPEKKVRLVKITYAYHVSILVIATVAGIGGTLLLKELFGVKYANATPFVIWVAFAYAFDGMYKMHVNYLFFSSKTHLIFLITMSAGAVNVLLCFLLIRLVGAVGVAQALLVGFIVSFILAWYLGQRVYPMPWSAGWRR